MSTSTSASKMFSALQRPAFSSCFSWYGCFSKTLVSPEKRRSQRWEKAFAILALYPTVSGAYLTLVVVALGELTQQPRYYDYISRLAPAGQQGTYMGFAFLPLGIGAFLAGRVGGKLLHHFGEVQHQPQRFWWALTAIGLATTLLLWIYDRVV